MNMWSVNVIILFLFFYECLSTGIGNVRFDSRNFRNVLRWNAVEPVFPNQSVLYSVEYWSDAKDQSFQVKKECQNITGLFCDLTAETPSVHDVYYQAKVSVNGQSIGRTTTFRPLADTVLGGANLSVYTTPSSLHVNVTLPLGPDGVSIKDIIIGSKNASAQTIPIYILTLTQPKWAAQEIESTTGHFVINFKNNDAEYCGEVVYMLSTERGRPKSENSPFCVTLKDDPRVLLRWALMSGAAVAAFVLVSVVCICKYVKGGKPKSKPQALDERFVTHKVLHPGDNLCIMSKAELCTHMEKTVYATILQRPTVPTVRPGGYSPQETPPGHTWDSSTGSSVDTSTRGTGFNHNDTSGQSSDVYGEVVVHVSTEEDESVKQGPAEDGQTSHQLFSSNGPFSSWVKGGKLIGTLPDFDAYESKPDEPLLLKTERNRHGELTLPFLTLQLQSCTDDGKSPVNPETRPLLSDVMFSTDRLCLASLQRLDSCDGSDSGCDGSIINTPTPPYCNTHYFPSKLVPDFQHSTTSSESTSESGYKQNWMPPVHCGHALIDSCNYRRTNWTDVHKTDEEGEEDEGRGEEERFFSESGHYTFKNSFPLNVSDPKIEMSHFGP
ncbi:interferon lambda receptor 1 [Mugil cephalus]|uniref:interferon lambda receptor 1 n=1 Tax=Mugil cephalus TaxID=48193 RepID=UPI001FB63008|nr:interferon lambda receptor 1 [Mugil cephalus]